MRYAIREVLLYLNEHTVQLAMSRALSQRVQQALNEDEEHIALES